MNYDEFKTEFVSRLQALIGERYMVSVKLARSGQNQPKDVLMIYCVESMRYLSTELSLLYEVYKKEHIPMEVLTVFIKVGFCLDDDGSLLEKSQVFYRLENPEHVLKGDHSFPYQSFLDFAIVFYRKVSIKEGISYSERITYDMLRQANLYVSDLMNLANKNTPEMFPYTLRDFDAVALETLGNHPEALKDPEVQFNIMCMFGKTMGLIPEKAFSSRYVLSCEGNLYGSTAIIYPELLKNIGEKLQSDFYILPCSKNESVIEALSEGSDLEELKREVQEVLKDTPEDPTVLTTNIYQYDRANGSLSIVG